MADEMKLYMPPGRRSLVWKNYAYQVDDKNVILDENSVVCLVCRKKLTYSKKTGSTTNLSNHSNKCISVQSAPKIQSFFNNRKESLPPTSKKAIAISDQIMKTIVKHQLPFSAISGISEILSVACPEYVTPGRTSMTAKIEADAAIKRNSLKEALQAVGKVSITTDFWTSVACASYMGITCHYINNEWKLVSRTLEVYNVNEKHTATNIATMLQDMEERWNLTNRVLAYVTDNAYNVVNAVTLNLDANHIRCNAHSIQLGVTKGVKVNAMSDLLSKCRRVVGHFKHSTHSSKELRAAQIANNQTPGKLIQDVPTRWNSTFNMIQGVVKYRIPINNVLSLQVSTESWAITLTELRVLESLIDVLEPFKQATEKLGGEKYITGSMTGTVYRDLKKTLVHEPTDSRIIKEVKTAILNDLLIRANSVGSTLHRAAALDPRFKGLKYLSEVEREEVWNSLTLEGMQLNQALAPVVRTITDDSDAEDTPDEPSPKKICLFQESDDDEEEVEGPNTIVAREVAQYRAMKKIPVLDPLEWWSVNKSVYPTMAKLAKFYLSAPSTSVPSERLFSKAGRTATKNRNRLTGGHLNDLVFLNSYYSLC